MLGPAESIGMAKWILKKIPMRSSRFQNLRGNGIATLMKRWVTGDKGEMEIMEQEAFDMELFELAREWMSVSMPH
jgi:hypothetical protein